MIRDFESTPMNVFKIILDGEVLPNKSIDLDDGLGEIPLVTVGDTAFPALLG